MTTSVYIHSNAPEYEDVGTPFRRFDDYSEAFTFAVNEIQRLTNVKVLKCKPYESTHHIFPNIESETFAIVDPAYGR